MPLKSSSKSGLIFLQKVSDGKVGFSRKLRAEMTPAEDCLWKQLRNRKLGGHKFRRQQIVEGFIVDFFCEEAKLVIELDGGIHSKDAQKKIDQHRRKVFELRGLEEIRFSNSDVLKKNTLVLETIQQAVRNRILPYQ